MWSRVRVSLLGGVIACCIASCGSNQGNVLPNQNLDPLDAGEFRLVARLAHLSDAQIMDEESPARLTFANAIIRDSWRPQEAYSTQLLDGTIRAVNRYHESGTTVDFLVHTGDGVDNCQSNELDWFLSTFDGGEIDPRSGPDDRPVEKRGPPELDPHHAFVAEGLYRNGGHGNLKSIPWYAVMGNHEHFAVGVFPVVKELDGSLVSPLPLPDRVGFFLPLVLDPVGSTTYMLISPANPGPPAGLAFPTYIWPNPDRRFISVQTNLRALAETETTPAGHGFDPASDKPWYSVSPVPGVRLIGLDSSDALAPQPAGFYSEGSIGFAQILFLAAELEAACGRGEQVIILTHHPSADLKIDYGSAVSPNSWRELLRSYPCVVLHLVGHTHRNRVWDQGNYLEIETSSILDYPQEARMIEVWESDDEIELRYWMFSHLDDCGDGLTCRDAASSFDSPPGSDSPGGSSQLTSSDPLREMRRIAYDLARQDAGYSSSTTRQRMIAESVIAPNCDDPYDKSHVDSRCRWLEGNPTDRAGTHRRAR
ncbi:MAG: metallophosphoesterase [Planctomycetes bacterium]|nr:metallophosphoesterase [Planctomycetota bacterium]